MPAWLLLMLCLGAWMLFIIASAAQVALFDARRGIPAKLRGGVSIFPVLPIMPLVLWVTALGIDLVLSPWGTRLIGSAHVGFAVLSAATIVRDVWRLRNIDTAAKKDGVNS